MGKVALKHLSIGRICDVLILSLLLILINDKKGKIPVVVVIFEREKEIC